MQNAPEIIYKDADLIAINKPSGWLSIPDRHDAELYSVKSWFEAKGEKIFIVHRIDRDTSGLLLLARNPEAHKYYNTLFNYGMFVGVRNSNYLLLLVRTRMETELLHLEFIHME